MANRKLYETVFGADNDSLQVAVARLSECFLVLEIQGNSPEVVSEFALAAYDGDLKRCRAAAEREAKRRYQRVQDKFNETKAAVRLLISETLPSAIIKYNGMRDADWSDVGGIAGARYHLEEALKYLEAPLKPVSTESVMPPKFDAESPDDEERELVEV